jgi:hypothetical protein
LTYDDMKQTQELYPEVFGSALWRNAQQISWISAAAFCVISVFAGWRLLKDHRLVSVIIAIGSLWVAGPGLGLISLASLEHAGARISASDVGVVVGRPLVWAAIWTLYLLFSKRVRNTYLGGLSLGAAVVRSVTSMNKRGRQVVFFGVSWSVLAALYFQILEPFGSFINGDEEQMMWTVILLPPILLWFGSWTYVRFVGVDD